MDDVQPFGFLVLVVSVVGLLAVLSSRLTERIKVPTPAFFLVGAAVAVTVVPGLDPPPERTVERLVTVALVAILFDGGMHIGWQRFRAAATPIVAVGVAGTFLTTAAMAVIAHVVFGLDWYLAALLGAAIAPTDPAVVFSVLGQRELVGRTGTILEGESGANDPVGIALMSSLLVAGGLGLGQVGSVAGEFTLQLLVGGVVGVLGGHALMWFMRAVPLPSEALYPLRTLAAAMALFGLGTVLHGSGFLAAFVAGIVIGDGRAPYQREIRRFHSSVASLGEIVAFVVLGLTVDLQVLARLDVWGPGLAIAVLLTVLVRPLLVGLCLLPVELSRNERVFMLFAGLKGAVPILLGSFLLTAHVADAERLYGVVVVVTAFSVLVQGSLVPAAVRLLGLTTAVVRPEPWAVGMRLRDEPVGAHEFRVREASPAHGRTVREITNAADDIWVSLVVREGRLLPVSADTTLRAGDDVLVLAEPSRYDVLASTFGAADQTRPRVPGVAAGTPRNGRAAGARRTTKETGT